jgi:hypothetical protein
VVNLPILAEMLTTVIEAISFVGGLALDAEYAVSRYCLDLSALSNFSWL